MGNTSKNIDGGLCLLFFNTTETMVSDRGKVPVNDIFCSYGLLK